MYVLIDNKSGTPIYDQIYSQLKRQIMDGSLPEGEALPSIRALAKELRISVITTKRAYDELERDGFIYAMPGKGFYVSPKNLELMREENLKKIEEHMREIQRLGAMNGLSPDELLEMFRINMEDEL